MTTSTPPSTTATTPVSELGASQLYDRLKAGERRALARFLTELERASPLAADLLQIASPDLNGPPVIGITGPPGTGKSTLTNALIAHWRTQATTIGVIAIDPSSPITRGAILGDRIRMTSALNDEGVFVRSLSSGGHLGGLSPAAVRLIDGFDAAGFDIVLMETVGTGQSEIDVAEIADVRVVVSAPGFGDDIQAMKSGLLEIADILVVNKADLPGAEQTRQQLAGAVSIRHGGRSDVPVLAVCSTRNSGIEELATTISGKAAAHLATPLAERRRRRARYLIAHEATTWIKRMLADDTSTGIDNLADDVLAGTQTATEAVRTLFASGIAQKKP